MMRESENERKSSFFVFFSFVSTQIYLSILYIIYIQYCSYTFDSPLESRDLAAGLISLSPLFVCVSILFLSRLFQYLINLVFSQIVF